MLFRLVVLVAMLLLISPRALAFTDDGHRLVAQVAEQFLTPLAKAKIALLLEAETEYGNQCVVRSFVDAAVWADCIKSKADYKAKYPDSDKWHYDDIPLCGSADYTTYCPHNNCLSAQVDHFVALLSDKAASVQNRLDALKFIIHFVGDAHQPLHAEDNNDEGGNKVLVLMPNSTEREKLHLVWDLDLVLAFAVKTPHPVADLVLGIDTADVQAWSSGTIREWLAESHEIARNVAYGELPGGLVCGTASSQPKKKPTDTLKPLTLTDDYVKHGRAQDFLQIRKAGVRLAWILNRALQ